MMQRILFITISLFCSFHIFSQPQEWAYFRPTNTGLPGEIVRAIAIDSSNNMWTTAYYWFWSDGGVAVKDQENIWHTWGKYDGYIPDERAHDIQFDHDQHVWVATDSGLASFDGKNWTSYTESDFGFPAYKFTAIAIDDSNHIWATYESVTQAGAGGVVYYDRNNWTVYTVFNSGLPTSEVGGIAVDSKGHVWVGSIKGLLKFDRTNWIQYNYANSPITGSVGSVIKDDKGNIWCISGSDGLIKYDGTSFSVLDEENSPLPVGNLANVAVSGDKMIVGITAMNSGCYIYDGQSWSSHPSPNHNYDVAIDKQGHFWMCGIGYLWEYNNQEWIKYSTHNTGLPDFSIDGLFVDSRNHKWISAGEGGATDFNDTTWVSYNRYNQGFWPNPLWYTSICEDFTEDIYGHIWWGYAGTYGAAIDYDPETGKMTIWESDDAGVNLQFIQSLHADSKGRIWVGLDDGGISMYDRQQWHHYNRDNSKLYSNDIMDITEDKNGDIYFGTYAGLARWRNGTIDTVLIPEYNGKEYYFFREIEVDDTNALWLGTVNGIAKYYNGNWTFLDTNNSDVMTALVTGIEIDKDGSLWISGHNTYNWPYYGGISNYDGKNWTHYYYGSSQLAHKQVEDIELDLDGNLWILTQSEALTVFNKGGLVGIDTLKHYQLPQVDGSNTSTGLTDHKIQVGNLDVWPNPVKDNVHLKFESEYAQKALVTLVSVDGKHALLPYQLQIKPGINLHSIDISFLPKGNYLLSIKSLNTNYEAKIIHQ